MSQKYIGKSGTVYQTIEPALGKGGEGTVYGIVGMSQKALKVLFKNQRTESKHKKLLAMTETQLPTTALEQITWPVDAVYSNGEFVGYVMPIISAKEEELNVFHSDKYNLSLSEKITIAKNLCAAINSIHNIGQVCGDLNPKNIVVNPQTARVTLVDTDSYHITDSNTKTIYRCEVGMPEYLAPEIHQKLQYGQTLKNALLPTFTTYTDLFALSVHIFALLMNGCHPFSCGIENLSQSQQSVYFPQPIENIASGFSPFFQHKNGLSIPKYAPEIDSLPVYIRMLFLRCFSEGFKEPSMRPSCIEWYDALSKMQTELKKCSKNTKHEFSSHLSKCPWCELESKLSKTLALSPQRSPSVISNNITYQSSAKNTMNSNRISNASSNGAIQNTKNELGSEGIFWLITICVPLIFNILIQAAFGSQIMASIVGSKIDGIASWVADIITAIGPAGFVIMGLVGTLIYNLLLCKEAYNTGFTTEHYVFSFLMHLAGSISWIVLLFIISIILFIIIIAIIVAVVIGIISNL